MHSFMFPIVIENGMVCGESTNKKKKMKKQTKKKNKRISIIEHALSETRFIGIKKMSTFMEAA